MTFGSEKLLLISAVAGVGILHTMVPDHWLPIALMARQRRWSRGETIRTAFLASIGHVLSTLLVGVVVWFAGVAFAQRFGYLADKTASIALFTFGGWIAFAAWRELQRQDDGIQHSMRSHAHNHQHCHPSKDKSRLPLLLILGSSPMVEGIPAFFAAGKYGLGLIAVMSGVFALSTIATYILLCFSSAEGLQRLHLGALERYGELLSGSFIALIGIIYWVWPMLPA